MKRIRYFPAFAPWYFGRSRRPHIWTWRHGLRTLQHQGDGR